MRCDVLPAPDVNLIPPGQPKCDPWDVPGLEIAVSCLPSGRVGGDLFDLFPLEGEAPFDRWCIFIGDASGHGLAASLRMAEVQSILRECSKDITGAAEMLEYINRRLCRQPFDGFVTAFLGIYEVGTRRLSYACAGHPPPFLKAGSNGIVSRMDAVTNYPIGIDTGEILQEAEIYIFPGDTVLLYTDGVTENRNCAGEMFSELRLRTIVGKTDNGPAELVHHIERTLAAFRQGRQRHDDQTVVAIEGILAERGVSPDFQLFALRRKSITRNQE